MRFAIVSAFGWSTSWWQRLQAEGHEVAVYIKPTDQKMVGDGLVQKYDWEGLRAWIAKDNAGTITLFDGSGLGEKAQELRRAGNIVIGGGLFMDRLEKDRAFGFRLASEAGCTLPPYRDFNSFSDALRFARTIGDRSVYFKSDRFLHSDATHGAPSGSILAEYLEDLIAVHGGSGRCIIQEKVEGIPISTGRWWNGRAWVGPYLADIEHKKFMDGDIGPGTGCSLNAVWFYQDESPLIAQSLGWDNLTSTFQKLDAPPGFYDINSVISSSGEAYFLEWTPRLGYDSEMTSGRLFPNLGDTLAKVALGTGEPEPSADLAYGLRVSVSPYPWEFGRRVDDHSCVGAYLSGPVVGDAWSGQFIGYSVRQVGGRYEVASPDGIVGLTYAQGGPITRLNEKAIEAAGALQSRMGLQYRTDGGKAVQKDAKALKEAGYDVHPHALR